MRSRNQLVLVSERLLASQKSQTIFRRQVVATWMVAVADKACIRNLAESLAP